MSIMSRRVLNLLKSRLAKPVTTKVEGKQRKKDQRMYWAAVTRFEGNVVEA